MTIARLCLAALLVAGACYSAGTREPRPSRQRDVLTRAEILETPQSEMDLHSVIRSLRPHFLAAPPGVSRTSSAPLAVYINGQRQNSMSSLSIRASAIAEVRYLDPTAALNAYGSMANGGALVVTLYDPSKAPRPPE
jgi:hypothetical protein